MKNPVTGPIDTETCVSPMADARPVGDEPAERTGRLVLGFWFGFPGLLLLGASGYQLFHSNPETVFGPASVAFISVLQIWMSILAVRGKFGIITAYLISTLALMIVTTAGGFDPGSGEPLSKWTAILPGIAFPAAALSWIGVRRFGENALSGNLMKTAAGLLVAVFMATIPALGIGLGKSFGALLEPSQQTEQAEIGRRMPFVRFRNAAGEWNYLVDKDTIYVVNFWATWCSPCLKELPELLAWYRGKSDSGRVAFLAVNTEGFDQTVVGPFLKKRNLEGLPVFTDPDEIKRQMGFETIPVTLLFKNREIVARHVGYGPHLISEIDSEVNALINETSSAGARTAQEQARR